MGTIVSQERFYEKEIEVINEEGVKVQSKNNEYCKALVNHKLRKELEEIYGDYWFKIYR